MTILLLFLGILSAYATPVKDGTPIKLHPEVGIIGGNLARSGQFPFAAAVYTNTGNGNYFCGGTLISSEWVLTAGQCVDGGQIFTIHLGSTQIDGKGDSYAVKVSSDSYVIHPAYDPGTLDNDIGLIWLREPVQFSDYLKPIDYLPTSDLDPDSIVTAIGWGQIGDDDPGLVNDLRWVEVTSLSNEECKITYGNQILDGMVCVDGGYNEGTCIGDTGGPLVQTIGMGHSLLVGISSFLSRNGCESTDPSGFTRLYYHMDWMKNVTNLTDNRFL